MDKAEHVELRRDTVLVKAREFALISIEDTVLLDGGRQLELVTGPLALSVLPILLPLINGTRTVEDILALVPNIPIEQTMEILERLLEWGVFTSGDNTCLRVNEVQNTLSFLKRRNPVGALNVAQTLLSHKHIVIAAQSGLSRTTMMLAAALRENGFQHVQARSLHDLTLDSVGEDSFLVSVVEGDSVSPEMVAEYDALCASQKPWLRTFLSVNSGIAEIGPMFQPGNGLCLQCLTRIPVATGVVRPAFDGTDHAIWAAILASELTIHLLDGRPPGTRSLRRYRLPVFGREIRTWPFAVNCAACKHDGLKSQSRCDSSLEWDRFDLLPSLFEESIATRNEYIDGSLPDQQSGIPIVSTKLMLNSKRIPLPQVDGALSYPVLDLLLSGETKTTSVPDLAAIALLLALSVGVKSQSGGSMRRWAPSGGNLGSTEAYLVATNIHGLDPGVYLYLPGTHELARLNQRNVDHVQLALRAASQDSPVSAMVVLVGAYSRIALKYRSFAYKLLHLDAGAASSQFLLVAAALGVRVDNVSEWEPGALEEALALRPFGDVPTQVFRLAPNLSGPTSREQYSRVSTAAMPYLGGLSHEQLAALSSDRLVERLIRCDRVVRERLPSRIKPNRSLGPIRLRRRIAGEGRKEETLGSALNRRSSIRRFSAQALKESHIRLILQGALANNVLTHSQLTVTVIVQHSSDLMAGVYRYDSETLSLNRQRGVFPRERTARLFFDPGYEDTPLIVWISGNVCVLDDCHRGAYQTMLVRSGLLGHRLWMASLGLGLGGFLVAGLASEAATQSNKLIDDGDTSFLAFLCGYPTAEDQFRGDIK